MCSDDTVAHCSADVADILRAKHPPASFDAAEIAAASDFEPLVLADDAVYRAIRSFPAGSSGGPDGFRPQHMVDLIGCKETGHDLLSLVTSFVNLLLSGKCPPRVVRILFGGRLIALRKKDGGIRPIAVGYYWRRLVAKCANAYGIELLANFFSPSQLGVGVAGGCEAAIHAARRFLCEAPSDYVLAKLDFSNAFNCLHRDTMLSAVAERLPQIYRFCHLSYSVPTSLVFGEFEIESREGAQQGDPLGPLLFCLTLQPVLNDLHSPWQRLKHGTAYRHMSHHLHRWRLSSAASRLSCS